MPEGHLHTPPSLAFAKAIPLGGPPHEPVLVDKSSTQQVLVSCTPFAGRAGLDEAVVRTRASSFAAGATARSCPTSGPTSGNPFLPRERLEVQG